MRRGEQQFAGRYRGAFRGFRRGASRSDAPHGPRGESGGVVRPQPGACGGARGDRGLHRRRRAGERRLPEGLCRLFRLASRGRRGRGAHCRRVSRGTSGVDVEVGRDADRQSDGFRRRGASLSRGTGPGRRQHGVPAGGAGGIRRFRSLARPGERRADRRRGERLLRTAAARRRDDLVRSRCGDVAYHPPVEAHGGVLPAAEPQRGREPAAPGADSRPHGEDLRARDREVGSDAAAGADHAAPQVPGGRRRARDCPDRYDRGIGEKRTSRVEASFVFWSGVSCACPVSESKRGISRA